MAPYNADDGPRERFEPTAWKLRLTLLAPPSRRCAVGVFDVATSTFSTVRTVGLSTHSVMKFHGAAALGARVVEGVRRVDEGERVPRVERAVGHRHVLRPQVAAAVVCVRPRRIGPRALRKREGCLADGGADGGLGEGAEGGEGLVSGARRLEEAKLVARLPRPLAVGGAREVAAGRREPGVAERRRHVLLPR